MTNKEENIMELTMILQRMIDSGKIDPDRYQRKYRTSLYDDAKQEIANAANSFEEWFSKHEEYAYLDAIQEFGTMFFSRLYIDDFMVHETLHNIDWQLFQKQKEWLNQQAIQAEDSGCEDNMPLGILNLMDAIQDMYESGALDSSEDNAWYTEKWYDEDIISILEELEIPATRKNIMRARQRVLRLFDDKSDRNEMLTDAIEDIFKGEE